MRKRGGDLFPEKAVDIFFLKKERRLFSGRLFSGKREETFPEKEGGDFFLKKGRRLFLKKRAETFFLKKGRKLFS